MKPAVYVNFAPAESLHQDTGLFRFRQSIGLGNLMCSWGDAVLYATYRGLPLIWPTWPQISREAVRSGRIYARLFENDGTYIGGLARHRLIRQARQSDAHGVAVVGPKLPYDVDWEHGRTVAESQAILKRALHAILAPNVRRRADAVTPREPFVAVHVRRGDFNNPVHHFTDGGGQRINQPIPIEWYVEAVEQARHVTGHRRVVCISDGTDDDLAFLSRLGGVAVQRESALVDLVSMSRASAFVASGSTFSQWISYLGQMPTWTNATFAWSHNLHVDPASRVVLS